MGDSRTHAQWRICSAKNRLGHPSLFTEFQDTNDEAVWLGILFSTTQKLKKNKMEFFGGTYGLHMLSPGGDI